MVDTVPLLLPQRRPVGPSLCRRMSPQVRVLELFSVTVRFSVIPSKSTSLVMHYPFSDFLHLSYHKHPTEGKGEAKPTKLASTTSTFTKAQPSSNSKRDRSDSQVEQAKLLAAISSGTSSGSEGAVKIEGKNGKAKKAAAVVTDSSATGDVAAAATGAASAKANAPVQSIGKRQVSDASDVTTLDTQTSLPFKKRRKPDSGSSNSSSASVNGSVVGGNSSSSSGSQDQAWQAERELALAVGRIAAGAPLNPVPTISAQKDTDSERDSTCSSRTSNVIETAGEGCPTASADMVGSDGFSVVNKV